MNILDILKDQRSKKQYIKEKTEAEIHFINQKKAIDGIKNKEWFKEIRAYRERIVLACNDRFRTMKSKKEMDRIQWELDAAMSFLNFLDNILAEELDREGLDILNS